MSNQIIAATKSPIDLNDNYDKEDVIGTLIVVLLKARNLNDKHSFRKSDVFAQAILNGAQKRTHVDIKGGQHPEWDGEVRFLVLRKSGERFRKMEVFCYSLEPKSEDLMGKGFVDISETLRTGEFDDWVSLEVDGVARGELYIEMTYYANAPAPTPAVVPNKLLSAIENHGAGLTRHPSKLAPAERLSRPQQRFINEGSALRNAYTPRSSESQIFIRQNNDIVSGNHLSSSHGTTPSGTPLGPKGEQTGKGSPLSNLRSSLSLGQRQQQLQVDTLPSILRPGLSASSSPGSAHNQHEHGRQDSITSPAHNGVGHIRNSSTDSSCTASTFGHKKNSSGYNPYIGGGIASTSNSQPSSPPRNPYITDSTNPYLSVAVTSIQDQNRNNFPPREDSRTSNIRAASRLNFHGRAGTPMLWQQENTIIDSQSNYTFPKPTVPTAYFENARSRADDRKSTDSHAFANITSDCAVPVDKRWVEAHIQARYQSPLPLPPESGHSIGDPPKTSSLSTDQSRISAIRRAEGEAARRREQELRDMELAMQLDRELNMAEGQAIP